MQDNRKVLGYLGLAARSRNLVTGYNTCLSAIAKRKLKLLIIADEVGEATRERMKSKCESANVTVVEFGKAEELSYASGKVDKGLFGITDRGLADRIAEEFEIIKEGADSDESI